MIKSAARRFLEMVTLVPIAKVDADLINILCHKVLKVREFREKKV